MNKAALLRCAAIAALSTPLISCLGGGGTDEVGGGNAFCESIAGGNAAVAKGQDAACLFCGVDNEGNAADGDLATFATVDAPNAQSGQGAWITATIQEGLVYPQGQRAGVLYEPPANSGLNASDTAVTVTTYLDGEQQESPVASSEDYDVLPPDVTGSPYTYKSFVTTLPFDAVRVTISDTQGATGPFRVHEICSNGSID